MPHCSTAPRWPEQRQGRVPRAGVEWLDRFQAPLFAFEPALELQKILHTETIGAYNRMVEARRQRLDAVNTGLPGVMWSVLLPGAMGCLLPVSYTHLTLPTSDL